MSHVQKYTSQDSRHWVIHIAPFLRVYFLLLKGKWDSLVAETKYHQEMNLNVDSQQKFVVFLTWVKALMVRSRNAFSTSCGIVFIWAIQSSMHINVSLGAWEEMARRERYHTEQWRVLRISITVWIILHDVTSDLVQRVEDSLSIVFGVQSLSSLDGDDGFFELLQPCPHQPSQDEGIPLHT